MSEPQRSAALPAPPDAPDPLQGWIASLRSSGAWRRDPARFHALEALARRLPGQQEPVRRLLRAKLQAAWAEHGERFAPAQPAPAALAARGAGHAGRAPLAQLNDYIRGAVAARVEAAPPGEAQDQDELASARRFRRAWDRGRTLDQVEQALARRPASAGPLNSHMLVLRSLALMREISPDYLRRFLVHVETLQWLDQAGEKIPRDQARQTKTPVRRRKK